MMRTYRNMILAWVVALSFTLTARAQDEPILVIDPQGHSGMIRDLLFADGGNMLVSVSDDKTIRLWDPKNGDLLKTIRGQIGEGSEGSLYAADLSADGRFIAVGGQLPEHEIRIYSRSTTKQVGILKGHTSTVTSLSFSKDGKFLASGSGDKTVKIWDISGLNEEGTGQGKLVISLAGHTAEVYGVAFSPLGNAVVSASFDGTLCFWKRIGNTFNPTPKVMKEHTDKVYCVAYSPDGQFIASGGFDGKILLWDAQGELHNIFQKMGDKIYTVSFSYSKNKLVAMTDKGAVYEVPYGYEKGRFERHDNTVTASSFSPLRTKLGNEVVATAGSDNHEIYLWDSETGEALRRLRGNGQSIWSVAFGKGLNVAFGTKYNKKSDQVRSDLEKTFDFSSFRYSPEKPGEEGFTRYKIEHNGKKLERFGNYMVKITGGGTIQNTETKGRIIRSYTYTPDGSKIVVGSSSSLNVYNADGSFVRELVGHNGEVWSVSVSADSKYLVSASSDQTMKLWYLPTGELLATLFVGTDNEWVCWTPKGFYAASSGGEKYIGWHVNKGIDKTADFYPVQTFRNKYYMPDVVKQTIAMGEFQMAVNNYNKNKQALSQIDANEIITESLPPTITWVSPAAFQTETSSTTIKIQAVVTSKEDITSVKVLLDGRPLANERGFKVKVGDTPKSMTVEFDVELVNTESHIQIFAANKNASVVSEDRIVNYVSPVTVVNNNTSNTTTNNTTNNTSTNTTSQNTSTNRADEAEELDFDITNYIKEPSLYVLTVGVSEFKKTQYNLTYADDDAHSMTELYTSQNGKLYKNVFVKELLNQNATRQNILDGFKWLKEKATFRDVVVIFMASHGANYNNSFYLLPHDGDAADFERTLIKWTDFSSILSTLPSKVVVFIDACHSGKLGSNVGIASDNTDALRNMASDETGVVIMAAATADESSLENSSWGHGAFTYALLEGMQKGQADIRPDKKVSLNELNFYVYEMVIEMTGGMQHPTMQKPSTISNMDLILLE